jgi:hypothetical protein
MRAGSVVKPLGVFLAVILVVLAGTAVAGVALSDGSSAAADGEDIDGQSPSHIQPENVLADADPEDGEIQLDTDAEDKRILIDTQHGNQVPEDSIQPLVEALVQRGHSVDVGASGTSDGFGTTSSYNATLQEYDAVLIVAPTTSFGESQIAGLEAYTEGGGRVVVLGEPTQYSVSSGLGSASVSPLRFGANDLTRAFGMRMGSDLLFNVDDSETDNNYKAIYANPTGSGDLSEGVDTVTFDASGHVVVPDDSDAEPIVRAAEGTQRFSTRRSGEYVTAARNGNFVLVADSTFVRDSEVYDADNEQFVSNLLAFMVTGDKPDDVPQTGGDDSGFGGGDGGGFNSTTP